MRVLTSWYLHQLELFKKGQEFDDLLKICHHALVFGDKATINFDDHQLRVTTSVEPLSLHFFGQSKARQEGFIFNHIVCCFKPKLTTQLSLCPSGLINTMLAPDSISLEELSTNKFHVWGSAGFISASISRRGVNSTTKSANA